MKNLSIKIGGLLLFFVPLILVFEGCEKIEDDGDGTIILVVNGNGHSKMNNEGLKEILDEFPIEDLSAEEEASLLYLREEEKMARDVYLKLYDAWDMHPFEHISESEDTHMEAVLLLIERYDLVDPVGDNDFGIFTNQEIQALYQELVGKGLEQRSEALKIGALIEEIDILDLINDLDEVVDNQDIAYVYGKLLAGSKNHLRAFVKNLKSDGVTYEPVHLSQELFDEIISAPHGHGG